MRASAPQFFTAPSLSLSYVRHGFSTREGGVSRAPYHSLNLGLHVGDSAISVVENRRRTADALGFRLTEMVCAQQVHGCQVAHVTTSDAGKGATSLETALLATDSLITDTPGILLSLFFADCLPIFFVDSQRPAVAIAHAGWRGLVGGVLEETQGAMANAFGSRPERLLVVIGPGISQRHFAVGADVADIFPPSVVTYNPATGQPHIDLAAMAHQRLVSNGVQTENIHVSSECTHSDPERYFSHRRDNGNTGRMGGFIGIVA